MEYFLLMVHIMVVGYWLGSELVINSTYRYVSWSSEMPFPERERLMDHVMIVDQHVRYALVLQASFGASIAAFFGYIPGGATTGIFALVLGALWFAFVEITHRQRHHPSGRTMALIDRVTRYVLIGVLIVIFLLATFGMIPLEPWLALKLLLFACVMACGLIIRLYLIKFFKQWAKMKEKGSSSSDEMIIRDVYVKATSALIVLWLFIAVIVLLSYAKYVPFG